MFTINSEKILLFYNKGKIDILFICRLTFLPGLSPAHLAIQKSRRDILARLLDLGCDVNSQEGKSGRGALSIATELGYGDMVDLLLSRGANVNSQVRVLISIKNYNITFLFWN